MGLIEQTTQHIYNFCITLSHIYLYPKIAARAILDIALGHIPINSLKLLESTQRLWSMYNCVPCCFSLEWRREFVTFCNKDSRTCRATSFSVMWHSLGFVMLPWETPVGNKLTTRGFFIFLCSSSFLTRSFFFFSSSFFRPFQWHKHQTHLLEIRIGCGMT